MFPRVAITRVFRSDNVTARIDFSDRVLILALLPQGLADPQVRPIEPGIRFERLSKAPNRFIVPAGVVQRLPGVRDPKRRARIQVARQTPLGEGLASRRRRRGLSIRQR